MFTKVSLKPDVKSSEDPYFVGLIEACDALKESCATLADYGGDMHVSYTSYGITCQFGERLLRLPPKFSATQVAHVSLEVPYWPYELKEGVYRRKRSHAVVERVTYPNGRPDSWRFTVHADSLAAANRLFDAIVSGTAPPTVPYKCS